MKALSQIQPCGHCVISDVRMGGAIDSLVHLQRLAPLAAVGPRKFLRSASCGWTQCFHQGICPSRTRICGQYPRDCHLFITDLFILRSASSWRHEILYGAWETYILEEKKTNKQKKNFLKSGSLWHNTEGQIMFVHTNTF